MISFSIKIGKDRYENSTGHTLWNSRKKKKKKIINESMISINFSCIFEGSKNVTYKMSYFTMSTVILAIKMSAHETPRESTTSRQAVLQVS